MKTYALLVLVLILLLGGFFKILSLRHDFQQWIREGELLIESAPKPEGIEGRELPPLLTRYLTKVLPQASLDIHHVRFQQSGFMALREGPTDKPFVAEQIVAIGEPGFSWTGSLVMFPFLRALVCDRLIRAEGSLQARLAGVIPVAQASGPAMLKGELLRYLAELPWAPWGFLHLRNPQWQEKSARELQLTLEYEGIMARISYLFDEQDRIVGIRVEDRPRTLQSGAIEPSIWVGEFADYAERQGVLIPQSGKVSWILGPDARKFTYFNSRIDKYKMFR